MNSRFKITVAAAALLAGTGFAYAQGTGMSHEGSSGGGSSSMQQSSPSSEHGGAAQHQQMNHSTQGLGSSQSEERSPAAGSNQRAEDSMKSKSKGMSSENETKGRNKEMNAEGRRDQTNQKAEGREDRMKAEGREGRTGTMNAEKGGTEGRTVGQAGAGAKLTTEQRTKITSVIRNEHVAPVNNVNFSVAVGTRVPHDVAFHPLPSDVVTIYPEWRGYNYILVRDEIVVIDPSTYEIVAVINS